MTLAPPLPQHLAALEQANTVRLARADLKRRIASSGSMQAGLAAQDVSAAPAYAAFLAGKSQHNTGSGFEPVWLPDFLYPFQRTLVEWAVCQGRGALFEDCGLGKTPQQLVWAENVRQKTGRPVLLVTPLAVGAQTQAEAAKFGIDATTSRDGTITAGITITNYERLHHFDPGHFSGVVCDESSAIKSFDSERRGLVTEFTRKLPYRLLCTATAAPNDYIELGTSSEALGYLGHMDMLGRFFVNDQRSSKAVRNWSGAQWRFKGHAQTAFWRWVTSWARALRRPSDLGFDDAVFTLPPLEYRQHVVEARTPPEDRLFDVLAFGLREEREELRRTIRERCEKAAACLTDAPAGVAWCHLNAEGDLLTELIDGAVQVKGSDSPEQKEEALLAFSRGEIRVLVTKPSIGAWGLNWQHCHRMTFFPSHSYEQFYQAVRRCWRFGQTEPVTVDIIATRGGENALHNLERKAHQADAMFAALVEHMGDALTIQPGDTYDREVSTPPWLS